MQPDAQLSGSNGNGGPTTLLTCHSQLPGVRLCLDFEDTTLAPVIRDASSGGHDASSSSVVAMSRANQHAARADVGAVIDVAPSADLDLSQPVSIEMWVQPGSTAPSWLLRHGGAYELGIDQQALYCVFGSNGLHASQNLSTTAWTHVACTYDGSTIKAYVNGSVSSCTSTDPSSVPTGVDTALAVGYAGGLDDVHVYARALAGTEIQGLAGVTSGTTSCPD